METMNKSLKVRTQTDQWRSSLYYLLRSPYLIVTLLAYCLIALMVFFYLKQAPVFASDMALVLPGSGSSSQFSIEEVGQASAQTRSPFSGGGFNPRVNYKEIIKSRDVIDQAAETLGIDVIQFGTPRVELTEQTSIISVNVQGGSSSQAQDKSWALYEAFQLALDNLRADETTRHAEGVQRALNQYEEHLNEKRRQVVEFQQRSLLVSEVQLEQAMRSLSELNQKKMYALSELKSKESFVRQLSTDLGVSPNLAGQAFALNTDTQFRGYLRELDDASAQISRFTSHWGSNHPKLKVEKKRVEQVRKALFTRSASLVGEQTADLLHTMDLTVSPGRAQLFADLVDAFARVQGDKARLDEMRVAQQQLQDRLKVFSRESAELERLEREARLAEAVYTSAAARLDAGKTDIFASYPVVQMLTPPSVPIKQKSPSLKIAVAAAVVGYLFVTLGVLVVWQRQYLITQLLKKS